MPPTPRDSRQTGSVVVGIPPSPLQYDQSVLTSPTTYYDYTEDFSTTEQSGGDDTSGLAAGFVHRIRTIIEEKASQEEAKRKQLQQSSQQSKESSETDITADASEIAATFELPNSSPVSNRITRDMVAAALETSFDDADETKGPSTNGSFAEGKGQNKGRRTSDSTQGSLARSASLLHSSFIQDEKSDRHEDSSTELKDSTFTDGPSSVWDSDSPTQGSADLTVRFSLPPIASQAPADGQGINASVTTDLAAPIRSEMEDKKDNIANVKPKEKRNSATLTIRAPSTTASSHKLTPPQDLPVHSDSLPSTPTTTVKLTSTTSQHPNAAPTRDVLNKPKVDVNVVKLGHQAKPPSKYPEDDDASEGSPGTAIIGETSFSTQMSDATASKKPVVKIVEDVVKPPEPVQSGVRTMAEFFNARRSPTRPFSAMNESETFKRLSQGCQQDDHLSDVKEESREDVSTTDLSSFKFPMPWHANRKQPKSRPRSRSDISPIVRNNSSRQSTRPNVPKPLAETRTIPSLNFSRLDLISKLNEALEARDRTPPPLDARRSKSYGGIHAPVPERALSSGEMRERYKSFFAAEDEFEAKGDEEPTEENSDIQGETESGSSSGPKLKRTVSPVEFIYEIDRLDIPSVNPLTARLSRLMPSLRNHKSWEHVLEDEEGLTQTIEDIRQLGDHRTPSHSSPVNFDETRAASVASFADRMQKAVTPSFTVSAPNLMKDLPPLPGSKDGKVRAQDGLGMFGSGVRGQESIANLDPSSATIYKHRSKPDFPSISPSPHEYLIARGSYRSLRHRSSPYNRPWNLEESYPWDDSVPPIDIALPSASYRGEPSSCRPSRLRQYGSQSSTGSETELLASSIRNALTPRFTNTPRPPQSAMATEQEMVEHQPPKPSKSGLLGSLKVKLFGVPSTKKIVKRNMSTPNFRHQSPLASNPVMPNIDGFAALPTVLSVSDELSPDRPQAHDDHSHSPVNPGDRYPTSALSPPSAFNLSEVRSFFSDDSSINGSSQRKARRDRPSLGKRLTTHLRSRVRSPSYNAIKVDVPPVPKLDVTVKPSQAVLPTPNSAINRRTRSADDCRTPRQSPHDAMQRAATSPDFSTDTHSPQRRRTADTVRVASNLDKQEHPPKQSQECETITPPSARPSTPNTVSPSRTHRIVERLRRLWSKSSGFFRHLGTGNGRRSQKKEEDREWSAGTDIEVSIEELPNARMAEAQDRQTNKKESIEPEGAWGKVVKKVVEGSVSVEDSRDSRAQTPKGDREENKQDNHGDKTPTQSTVVRQPHLVFRPATAP